MGLLFWAWVGCAPAVRYPDVDAAVPTEAVVQVRKADVVYPWGTHYYFVSFDPDGDGVWHRTEVLRPERKGHHVWFDRLHPDSSFDRKGLRPARIVAEHRGPRAERLLATLETVTSYKHRDRYRLTGPNSNSFASWVLRESRVGHDMEGRGIGRRDPARIGLSDSRTGVALHTPALGLELGILDGVELNLGPVTLGVDLVPPALETPFGRAGFPEPNVPVGISHKQRKADFAACDSETHLPSDERWLAARNCMEGNEVQRGSVKGPVVP